MIPSRLAGGLAVVVSCRGSRSLLFEQQRDAMNVGKMQMQHGEGRCVKDRLLCRAQTDEWTTVPLAQTRPNMNSLLPSTAQMGTGR
jgi:hypothetical protein